MSLLFCGLKLGRTNDASAQSKSKNLHGGSLCSQFEELECICRSTQAALSSWSKRRERKFSDSQRFYLQDAGAGALNFALGRLVQDIPLQYKKFRMSNGKEVRVSNGKEVLTGDESFRPELENLVLMLSIQVLGPVRRACDGRLTKGAPPNFYKIEQRLEVARSAILQLLAKLENDVLYQRLALDLEHHKTTDSKRNSLVGNVGDIQLVDQEKADSACSEKEEPLECWNTYPSSDIYNLSLNYLPRGPHLAWRWCEGACRLRANASLTPRDVSKNWVEGSSCVSCRHCSAMCFGNGENDQGSVVSSREMRQAMKYFIESHVITLQGKLAWVCHICFNRNRWNGDAGPMSLEAMWIHFLTRHEPSKCC